MQCLAKISEAIDRNTALMELLVSQTMHAQPGATGAAMPSSTPQEPSNETALLRLPKNVGRFKSPAQPTSHKGTDELSFRVSLILDWISLH
jgi:hypothetical protein